MKKFISFALLALLLLPLLTSCNGGDAESSAQSQQSTEVSAMIPDKNAEITWKDEYADANSIGSAADVGKLTAFKDGVETTEYASEISGDTRYLFCGESSTRAVNLSEGYALTLPSGEITADFSLGALRSKYINDSFVLTVTYENQNPYGDNENGFKIYYDEWLARYIESIDYLTGNNIRRSRMIGVTTELLPGYTVNYYDMSVTLASRMKYDCYSIAVVRPTDSYEYFYLFVLKSEDEMFEEMDTIIASFKELPKTGTPVNSVGAYELKLPESWNDETREYFESVKNSKSVDFGAFYARNDPEYISWLQGEEALDTQLDIFMTYLHIAFYDTDNSLDLNFVNSQAGGDGKNGKPVLELTYQFTTTNNALGGYTPMFDICRGRFDEKFKKLAQDIKSYGKPVLFRLNNEMNTDWTSYCGMVTMLDPDIFIDTWRHLYDIFEQEGVDNCIWIFNPIAVSCPYSNWGDMLNYFPGPEYVQMLGLTSYQMNNGDYVASFKEMYSDLYEKNTPYFDNYPAIIGEFGCAAGGDVVYDWDKKEYVTVPNIDERRQQQATWIKGMFECFKNNQKPGYEFCKNIKIATWFSANDYATVGEEQKILNYLQLDSGVPLAIAALKQGISELRALE